MSTTPTPSWDEILRAVFARQEELMMKYKPIEGLPDPPLSVHTPHAQRILKDFAWRTVEELAEAYEQRVIGYTGEMTYTGEEMADALHFMVELLIFAGITPGQCLAIVPVYPTVQVNLTNEDDKQSFWDTASALAMAMHHLKNKPWKVTPVPTNEGDFRNHLLIAFESHVHLWAKLLFTMEDLHGFYFKKSQVNQQRQENKY